MYEVEYRENAKKAIRKIPRNWGNRITDKINKLSDDPYAFNNNVTKLVGEPGYRLRVGDYRVIYEIDDDVLVIDVINIGSRGRIYQ